MSTLSRKAQAYIAAIYVAGIAVTVHAALRLQTHADSALWERGLFIAFAVLTGSRRLRLMPNRSSEDHGSMTLGFAISFLALLRFGTAFGMLVGSLGMLSACVWPRLQRPHQMAFNVALTVITVWVAGVCFLELNGGSMALDPLRSLAAVVGATLVYFVVNTYGVALIIGLATQRLPSDIWRQSFLWTAPSYFAAACIGALALIVFKTQTVPVLLFGAPMAYLIHKSYSIYIEREEEKQKHIESLEEGKAKLSDLYLATIKSLALAIDAKDRYMHQHILRVQRYAVATGRRMGLSGDELEGLNTGALLHDIGKLAVPEHVLLKPGRLTDEEYEKIKKHPEIGAAILDPVEFPWPVLPVVKYHHEKWDGTGYPEGLIGENIPQIARIMAVADVYDALTSDRSYRSAWSHEMAIDEIRRGSGSHFDPQVVAAFDEIIEPVIHEMATEGFGPLAPEPVAAGGRTPKAVQAARDIQGASSELLALYEVADTLSRSLGLDETLEILARKLHAIFPDTACLFLVRSEGTSTLGVRAAIGLNREFFESSCTWGNSSMSQGVVRSKQTYRGAYDPGDLMLTSSQTSQWAPLRSAIIVPITHEGEVLGTLNLYHEKVDAFSDQERRLLETVADRTSVALRNGLLVDPAHPHAVTDPLTGLYSPRYLSRWAESALVAAPHSLRSNGRRPRRVEQFALFCLDIDSFRPINDGYGHQKGDEILCAVSDQLRRQARDVDVVVRYGGDEFLFVLVGADENRAAEFAEILRGAVGAADCGLERDGIGPVRLQASIGCALYPNDGHDMSDLVSAAESRMQADKTNRKLGRLATPGSPALAITHRVEPRSLRVRLPETRPAAGFAVVAARSASKHEVQPVSAAQPSLSL